jgi:hypothetical protein
MSNEWPTEQQPTSLQSENVEVPIFPAFKVRTMKAGVMISAISANQEGQELLVDGQALPAIFNTLGEALKHIDQLRSLVVQHFENAAQIGMRVIAAQNEASQEHSQDNIGVQRVEDVNNV